MKFDMSKFKKVREDHRSAVLRHPDGHQITIAKDPLSPKMRTQLSQLPMHFDEGGQVPDDSSNGKQPIIINVGGQGQGQAQQNYSPLMPQDVPPVYDRGSPDQAPVVGQNDFNAPDAQPQGASRAPASFMGDVGSAIRNSVSDVAGGLGRIATPVFQGAKDFGNGLLGNDAQAATHSPPQTADKTGSTPPSNYPIGQSRAPGAVNNSDPFGLGAYNKNMMAGVNSSIKGLTDEAKAAGDLGSVQAQTADQQAQSLRNLEQDHQANFNALLKERQDILKDIQNNQIDPNHYMNQKSGFEKVASAIGLILGGIGGGLTGQGNPALDYLHQQINRDIEAQKANLGKRENLLSANLRQFGNLNDAENMTRAIYSDIYSAQLQKAAALSADPLAKAKAMQAIGELQMKAAPLVQQISQRQAVMGGLQNGRLDPATAIRFMVPENQQGQAFKELQAAQNHQKQSQVIMDSFDSANKQNTVSGRAAHLGFEPASVAQIKTAIMPYLKDAEGRINEQELERTDALIPAPGDSPEKIAQKRQGLVNFLEEKSSTPMLESFGIRIPKSNMARPNYSAGAGYKR